MFFTMSANITQQAKILMTGMPESLALLAFGVSLVVLTVGLRWMFDRKEQSSKKVKIKR